MASTIHGRIDKKDLQVRQTSLADVQIPLPAIPPLAHPQETPAVNKTGGKHHVFTLFPKDPNCEECRRTKVSRAPYERNLDDRADRIKIAERFEDMVTADHKVLNE